MEQPPRICPRCQQANFPVAEFCRHCGEPMYEMGPLSRSSLCSRCIGHAVDGAFWVIDELMRWWEIGGLTRQLRSLRRRRLELIRIVGDVPAPDDGSVETGERAELLQVSEEISRVASRDETLRKLSWALTPELLLIAILLVFLSGIFWLRPRTAMPTQQALQAASIESLTPFKDVPLPGYRLIETAAWYGERLYVGGDAGLTVVDPQTGVASEIRGLPDRFFVRHLFEDQGRLLIAGLGGIWQLDPTGLKPAFEEGKLPFNLINRIDSERKGLLIGTVGQGLMHGRGGQGLVILGTAGLTIQEFAWLDGELWMLHERGLLRGDGTTFASVPVSLNPGTQILSITPGPGALFLGTTDGVIAGFKQGTHWVWMPLPAGPTRVTDLQIAGNSLLVLGREGLFRWRDNRFERVFEMQDGRGFAIGSRLLAMVGAQSIRLATIAGSGLPTPTSPIPTVAPAPGQPSLQVPMVPTVSPVPTVAPAAQPAPFNGLPSVSGNTVPSVMPSVSPAPGPSSLVPAPGAYPSVSPASPIPPSPAPMSASPIGAASGFLNEAAMPPSLRGPLVTSVAWDGSRLWVGTANDGLWKLENGSWNAFQPANGGLADPQVVSLWSFNDRTFLFSWVLGLMTLDGGKPSPALSAARARGFLAMAGDPAQPLLLFEGGYIRRLTGPDKLEDVTRVPEDYYLTVRSLQVAEGKPVVITDQGFLRQDNPGHWALSRFDGETGRVKASISAVAPDGRIFAGLSDGRIFQLDKRQTSMIGKLDDRPRTLTWAGTLWAASGRQIQRLLDGRLQQLVFDPGEPIVLIRPIAAQKRLIVSTTRGIQALAQEF